jgi:hypothetical protein
VKDRNKMAPERTAAELRSRVGHGHGHSHGHGGHGRGRGEKMDIADTTVELTKEAASKNSACSGVTTVDKHHNCRGASKEAHEGDEAAKVDTKSPATGSKQPTSTSQGEGGGFLHFYENHRLILDFVFSGTKAFLSDVSSQLIAATHQNGLASITSSLSIIDWQSVVWAMTIAEVYMTPMVLVFFTYLGHTNLSKFQKVFVDQFVFAPVYTAGVIALKLSLKYSLWSDIVHQVVLRLPSAMLYGWLFWVPSKIWLYQSVDVKYHLLISQLLSLFWNTILSCII